MTKTKNIKVQYSSRANYGSYYRPTSYTNYPKIQMEGKWLEALGFVPQPEPMMVAEGTAGYGR